MTDNRLEAQTDCRLACRFCGDARRRSSKRRVVIIGFVVIHVILSFEGGAGQVEHDASACVSHYEISMAAVGKLAAVRAFWAQRLPKYIKCWAPGL